MSLIFSILRRSALLLSTSRNSLISSTSVVCKGYLVARLRPQRLTGVPRVALVEVHAWVLAVVDVATVDQKLELSFIR